MPVEPQEKGKTSAHVFQTLIKNELLFFGSICFFLIFYPFHHGFFYQHSGVDFTFVLKTYQYPVRLSYTLFHSHLFQFFVHSESTCTRKCLLLHLQYFFFSSEQQ